MTLATYICKHCEKEFEAHPSAKPAELGYCSQRCLSDATGQDTTPPR